MIKSILLAVFVLLFSSITVFAQPFEVGEKPIMYGRADCPHCTNVKNFMASNEIEDQYEYKEIINNEENQAEFTAWLDHFEIPADQRGVPFMVVDEQTYLFGDTPVIEYFAEKNNIEVSDEYKASGSDTIFLVIGGLVMASVFGYAILSSFKKK